MLCKDSKPGSLHIPQCIAKQLNALPSNSRFRDLLTDFAHRFMGSCRDGLNPRTRSIRNSQRGFLRSSNANLTAAPRTLISSATACVRGLRLDGLSRATNTVRAGGMRDTACRSWSVDAFCGAGNCSRHRSDRQARRQAADLVCSGGSVESSASEYSM